MKYINKTVLLVEDEEGVRKNIAQFLRLQDIHVIKAENGKIAYELFEEHVPDLLITDIRMPEMDGLSLIEKIRKHNQDIPIIIMSAHSEKDKLMRAIKLNLVDYVIKPINRADLKKLIEHSLTKSTETIIDLGFSCTYNTQNKTLQCDNKLIELTTQQLRLMQILIQNKGQVITGEHIFFELKNDYTLEYNSAAVRNMIKRIRSLLPEGMIENIYGGGYRLSSKKENPSSPLNVYDELLEAIAIFDTQHNLIQCNRAMLTLFGYKNIDTVLGRSIFSFALAKEKAKIEEGLKFDEYVINEIYLQRQDRSIFIAKTQSKNSVIANQSVRIISITNLSDTINQYARDSLTSLHTRVTLEMSFYNLMYTHHIQDKPAAALFIDIDNFKNINDTLGHQVGDAIIKEVASLLRCGIRKDDSIFRWGGDEFLIFLFDTSLENAMKIAENLRKSIQNISHDSFHRFSCSFGIDAIKENDTLYNIVYRIDTALLKAKQNNKNCIVQYRE